MATEPKSKEALREELATLVAAYAGPIRRNAPEPRNKQGDAKGRRPWWQRRQSPKKLGGVASGP
jgi:hypothetical protein